MKEIGRDRVDNARKNVELTATEISNIWASYMKNSMETKFYEYFIEIVEDTEVKEIINTLYTRSRNDMSRVKEIFEAEDLALPLGFTNEDTDVRAPKVISDAFILAFGYDFVLLTINTYSDALTISTRKDIRKYFQDSISEHILFQNRLIEIMQSKGLYTTPPKIAIENEVHIIGNKKYRGGLLGSDRTLNVSEIANLVRIIHRAQFSKMAFVLFSKIAQASKLKEHFKTGAQEIQKVLDSLQPLLTKENIPVSAIEDYMIYDSDVQPFSDKLMLFFINTCLGVYCLSMISRAITSCLRSDVVSKVLIITKDMMNYYNDGIELMIKNEWFEAPPQSIDMNS